VPDGSYFDRFPAEALAHDDTGSARHPIDLSDLDRLPVLYIPPTMPLTLPISEPSSVGNSFENRYEDSREQPQFEAAPSTSGQALATGSGDNVNVESLCPTCGLDFYSSAAIESHATQCSIQPTSLRTYVEHFNAHVKEIAARYTGDSQGISNSESKRPNRPLYSSGAWSGKEKAMFFCALQRRSRYRPDLIAADVGTKTVVEVCGYLASLHEAAAQYPSPKFTSTGGGELEGARQMSDAWIEREEAFAKEMELGHGRRRKTKLLQSKGVARRRPETEDVDDEGFGEPGRLFNLNSMRLLMEYVSPRFCFGFGEPLLRPPAQFTRYDSSRALDFIILSRYALRYSSTMG
jgi:hypothetical protein